MAVKAKTKTADPVITEIVRNGLVAVTEEMKINLMRTAYNMIIYEALDFTVGLFDAQGNTVSIGLGLPMFIRGMSETVKAKIRHFGDNLDPGDILLTNDAYTTGSHLNHMTFSVPIFHDGELVAFSCCMAHWPDVGGTIMEGTTDIYSEGLQMPIVKIHCKGVPNEELIELIKMNVRLPERAMGDFRAQLAAVKTGERRFMEMIRKYGRDEVLNGIVAIMDQSEAVARERVRAIPDGVYEAESFMDDDGINVGQRVPIVVKVTVKDDQMTVDLTGVSKQVQGFYNSGKTAGMSCAQVAFKCLTSSLDLPINDGQFRALDIVLPAGRVVSAVKPAAMRMWMTYPMTIVDTIFKALAPALPNQVIAGHHADLCVGRINGRRPKDDSFYIYLGGLIGGGWGAKHNSDGRNAVIAMNDGDTHNGPSEQVEAKYPLLVERYTLRPDSGGAGRFRGGLGMRREYLNLEDARFSIRSMKHLIPPNGCAGGGTGRPGDIWINPETKDAKRLPTRYADYPLRQGDIFRLDTPGGGGHGDPLARDPQRVLDDVREGYVSAAAAERDYGVVLRQDGGVATVDEAATTARRAKLKADQHTSTKARG
jgi:N-methylhydantoinase B